MNEFLRNVRLLDHFTVELEIERSVFIGRLMGMVDPGGTDTIFTAFEAFSSSKKEYKGSVGDNGFKIRRRRRFFETNMNLAVASGELRQRDNCLIIDTEINSFNNFFIVFYIFALVFYGIFIGALFFADNNDSAFIGFPFLLFHATFMLGIPYMIMRRSTQRMKYDLTREFYYIASNKMPYSKMYP